MSSATKNTVIEAKEWTSEEGTAIVAVSEAANTAMVRARIQWEEGNALAKKTISCYINVGRYLLEAREEFPGDKEFGQYRQEMIPDMSTKWAGDLMRIARRFTDASAPNVPISVLKEIASAPEPVINEVYERVAAGNPPTVKEARSMAQEAREPAPVVIDAPAPVGTPGDVSGTPETDRPVRVGGIMATPEDDTSRAAPDTYDQENPLVANERKLLQLPEEERLEKAENYWHAMGFSMFFENPAVYSSISIVEEYICAAYPQYEDKIMKLKMGEQFL